MEFVKSTSGQVTDITIPEGNVIKIEEAATGRVLWEKNLLPDDLSDISLEWFTIGLNEIAPDYADDNRYIDAISSPTSSYINSQYKNNSKVITIRACVNANEGSSLPDTIYEAPCLYRTSNNEWARITNSADLIRFGNGLSDTTRICGLSDDGNVILVHSSDETFSQANGEQISPFWFCSNIQYGDTLKIEDTNNKDYGLLNANVLHGNISEQRDENNALITTLEGYNDYSPNPSIVYAPELKKYLVSGFLDSYYTIDEDSITTDHSIYRCFTIPETFNSFKITEQDGKKIVPESAIQTYVNKSYGRAVSNPCWSSKHSLFFAGGVNGPYERYLLTSPDGITWDRKVLFSDKQDVQGVINLSTREKLCAVGTSKVALSTDGVNWEEKNLPVSITTPSYNYSPDYDLFIVIRNQTVYVTRDFETWKETSYKYSNLTFTHTKSTYCGDGIFAFRASKNFVFLTTKHPIRGTITL